MKDIDIFKKIKKYSKLSLIFTILIFTISIVSFVIISITLFDIGQKNLFYKFDSNDSIDLFFISLLSFSGIIIIVFSILIFIYNVLTIVKTCSLNESKDKVLLIIMSVLGIVWLGIISNIVIFIIANSNIKRLSEQENNNENCSKEVTKETSNIDSEGIAK